MLAIDVLGLNLLTGVAGQISLGHGAFFGIGAFTAAILVVDHGWTIEATFPVAAILAAIVGVAVGFPALRLKGLYLALITLGLAVLFPLLVKKFVEGPGGVPLLKPKRSQVGSMIDFWADDIYRYYVCLAILAVLFLLAWNLVRGRMGRAMIAVRDQEVAASTVGISVANVKVWSFALSAAYAGLAPTPWRSGKIAREQGISKAGNPRLRHTMVELAWLWVRHQPDSALSRWFRARVGQERGRVRRVAIVALARRLLIALWRYVGHGEVPEGAVLKAA